MAQDYQTFYSDRMTYYLPQKQELPGQFITYDSIKVIAGDTVLYPFRIIKYADSTNDCYTINGVPWIGEKIVIDEEYDYFFNDAHDTIRIDKKAQLNEVWIMYGDTGRVHVQAKVANVELMDFLGLSDSVKVITLTILDSAKTPLSDTTKPDTFLLSKNYGFIKLKDFYEFPRYNDSSSSGHIYIATLRYELAGTSKPKAGIQNLKTMDIYDFNIGDELHTEYKYVNTYIYHNRPSRLYSRTVETRYNYFDRTDYGEDSIVYMVWVRKKIIELDSGVTETRFENQKIRSVVKPNSEIDIIPGWPAGRGYTWILSRDGKTKIEPSKKATMIQKDEDCWVAKNSLHGCYGANVYEKGLGGPYFSCINDFGYQKESRTLVYYKKDGQVWGNSFTASSEKETLSDTAEVFPVVRLYPNPATDHIVIDILEERGPYQFKLIAIDGRIVINEEIRRNNHIINISPIPSGVYYYMIGEKRGGKLVVQ